MKQTAVEYLIEQLQAPCRGIPSHIIEQAKEMEKQQIEDAHIEGQRVFDKYPHTQWTNDQAEIYYNETYESKGSDEVEKSEKPINLTSSKTEISDEEIEEAAKDAWSDYVFDEGNLYYTTFKCGWEYGIKWYREQLKQRQWLGLLLLQFI